MPLLPILRNRGTCRHRNPISIKSGTCWDNIGQGMKQFLWSRDYYVILTVEYGGNENIHIITSDVPLCFVMRCEASNDKIQWSIGYISWPKGMKYIAKMNEWMIPNNIFLTSRIKIWIHTEWSEQSRGPAKAACVSDGFNGVYSLYTSTVTNTELSEGSFDHQ